MTTVLDIIDKGTTYLEKHGVEDARRNMQLLVAHQLGCTRMDLYIRFDEPLEEDALEPLREALKRRGSGTPVQHLLGTVGFRQHEFRCDARALIPRPETEELSEWLAKNAALEPGSRALDLGCGSGILGLSLAADFPESTVHLSDISPEALQLTRENAAKLALKNVQFWESDLFAAIPADQSFELIVANLPYVGEKERDELARELHFEPEIALFSGPDGLDLMRRFIPEAAARLAPGGRLMLEIGHSQSAAVESLLRDAGLDQVTTIHDLARIPRFPSARKPG